MASHATLNNLIRTGIVEKQGDAYFAQTKTTEAPTKEASAASKH
jgi:hypothetical protein